VLRAPPGMSRAMQNKSKWDNRHKCVLWTVEWVLEDGWKVFGNCQETRTIQDAFVNAVGKRRMQGQQSSVPKSAVGSKPASECPAGSGTGGEPRPSAETHFYLHRPNLPSNAKCVIPIQPDAVVKDVVRDRVLIEFPTIFVSSASEEKLQNPFITEAEYIKQHGNEPLKDVAEILKGNVMKGKQEEDGTSHEPLLKLEERD
jgi:hypothetical protein